MDQRYPVVAINNHCMCHPVLAALPYWVDGDEPACLLFAYGTKSRQV